MKRKSKPRKGVVPVTVVTTEGTFHVDSYGTHPISQAIAIVSDRFNHRIGIIRAY